MMICCSLHSICTFPNLHHFAPIQLFPVPTTFHTHLSAPVTDRAANARSLWISDIYPLGWKDREVSNKKKDKFGREPRNEQQKGTPIAQNKILLFQTIGEDMT